MRSAVPVDHVEVVFNGAVIATIDTDDEGRSANVSGDIPIDRSGWLLLRAWNERSNRLIFDLYPYATTTPVWITVDGETPRSEADADYFIAWMERLMAAATGHPDYNTADEREAILAHFEAAKARFAACR